MFSSMLRGSRRHCQLNEGISIMTNATEPNLSGLKTIPTSFSHRGFILIGASLILFEIVFLILYINEFWLAFNLLHCGVPTIVAISFLAHKLLVWFESP